MTEPKSGRRTITEREIIEQVENIRDLRTLGATDRQIRQRLNLSISAFNRRVVRMNKLCNEIMRDKFATGLMQEVSILHDRMMRTIRNCEVIATSDATEPADKIEAERLKIDVSVALVKLLHEGPAVLGIQLANDLIPRQQELDNKLAALEASGDDKPDIHVSTESESTDETGTGTTGRGTDNPESP